MDSNNNQPASFTVEQGLDQERPGPPGSDLRGSDREGVGTVLITMSGAWKAAATLPAAQEIRTSSRQVDEQALSWHIQTASDFSWDSCAMVVLLELARYCADSGIELDVSRLPSGMQRLLKLATAVKPITIEGRPAPGLITALGSALKSGGQGIHDFVMFIGSLTIALARLASGRSHTRKRDLVYFFEQSGPQAIAIVALISVLVGMILAYLGSVQLRQFGAEVYVANLVALGMVREMAPLMTAVIMAGRTGAAYAAQLGAMQSNEEIDAITTLGLSPMEYLVVPRFLALLIVMPMLCVFSNVVGIVGGSVIAATMGVNLATFMGQAGQAVAMGDVFSGLFKSLVFAGLIAIAGCQAGIQSGRSSAAVGQATTRAVVHAIVYLVVADTVLNVLYDKLGI